MIIHAHIWESMQNIPITLISLQWITYMLTGTSEKELSDIEGKYEGIF